MNGTGRFFGRISFLIELGLVTSFVLAISHLLYQMRGHRIIGPAVSLIVALIFLYVPVMVLWVRKRPIDFLDRNLKSHIRSCSTFLITAVLVFPLFLVGAHFWQIYVMGLHKFHAAGFPHFWNALLVQLILIALPEEFFFRGYFQSVADQIFNKRWKIFGAELGWGWVITAVVFAFGHSMVYYQWWHFSIFFPALLFGYLREKTGSITAPVLFHTASNLIMAWFTSCY